MFADDGVDLYFTVEGTLWKWDGLTVSEVSQAVIASPNAIAYINRKFIIAGDNGLFATSDVSDGDTYNALNYAEAETAPDALVRPYVFNQLVYMLGATTTEMWTDTGSGNPPLARRDSSLVNVGTAGRFASTNTDSYLYWLGDDLKFYQCVGANARNKTTTAISNLIEGLDSVDDCIMSSFVYQGQDFVLVVFPSADESILYSETYDYWVELGTGGRWYGNAVMKCYGKTLVSDYRSGNVYELDKDTYDDAGDARIRVRTLPSVNGKMIGQPGQQVTVGKLRLNMEVGVGLSTGQGVDPVLMCEFSPDGGQTWRAERFVSIGEMGDYTTPVDFWDFCTGYDVVARITCSDPVYLSMFDGEIEIEAAGF
jgi:hypothetical protein